MKSIVSLAMGLIVPIFCLSFSMTEPESNTSDPEQLKQVLSQSFNPSSYTVSQVSAASNDLGGKTLSGNITFLSYPGVQVEARFNASNKPAQIVFVFPQNAGFKLMHLNKITNGALAAVLPTTISDRSGIRFETMQINYSGSGSLDNLALSLKSEAWDFMDYKSFIMKGVKMKIQYNPGQARKVSGNIEGNIQMGSAQLATNMVLPDNKNNFKIEGVYQGDLSLMSAVKGIGGQELVQQMTSFVPASFLEGLKTPNFKWIAEPGAKRFTLTAEDSFGKGSLVVNAAGVNKTVVYQLYPKGNFRFASIDQKLSWLDNPNIQLGNVMIQVSNSVTKRGNGKSNKPGLFLQGEVSPTNDLAKILKGKGGGQTPKFILNGGVDAAYNVLLAMEQDLKINLGNNVMFEGVNFRMENSVTSGGPKLELDGSISVPIDAKNNLRFTAGFSTLPTTLQFGGEVKLEAVNGTGTSEWRNPFGIPSVAVVKLGGGGKLHPVTGISELNLIGKVKLGKYVQGQRDKRVMVGIDEMRLNIVTPMESRLQMSAKRLNVLSLIEAFNPQINFSGEIRNVLNTGLDNAELLVDPKAKNFKASGDIKIMNHGGHLTMQLDQNGFLAEGWMDKIDFKAGSMTLFAVRGVNSENPNFKIAVGANPSFRIDGAVDLMGIASTSTFININSKGFKVDARGNLLGGALSAKVVAEGSNMSDDRSISLDVTMEQKVRQAVEKELVQFIKDQAKNSDQELTKAKNTLQRAKQGRNDFEKFFLDASSEIVGGLNKIQGGMAIAGVAITKGVFSTLSVESIHFHGSLKQLQDQSGQVKAKVRVKTLILGKVEWSEVTISLNSKSLESTADIIADVIGKQFLNSFSYLGAEVENLAGEFSEFGKDFVKAFDDVGKEAEKFFADGGRAMEGVIKDLGRVFNGKTFPRSSTSAPLSVIAPGYRHYEVTIHSIRVITASDEKNVGEFFSGSDVTLEIWGGIFVYASGATAPNGTNAVAWSKNRNGHKSAKPGGSIPVNHTKHLYARQGTNPSVKIAVELYEHDGVSHIEDDKFGLVNKPVSLNYTVNNQSINITGAGSSLQVTYSVKAHAPVTGNDILYAVKTGNTGSINNLIRRGGDLRSVGDQAMNTAVQRGDDRMVNYLIMNNIHPNGNHLNVAFQANQMGLAKKFIIRGMRPNVSHFNTVVNRGDVDMANLMLSHGIRPDLGHFQKAMGAKNYKLASLIAENGVKPTINELNAAQQANDLKGIQVVLENGVIPNVNNLNTAVKAGNKDLYETFAELVAPDANTLLAAAEVNHTEMFVDIGRRGVSANNAQITQWALAKNNLEIFQYSLEFGANPNTALDHALSSGKREAVTTSLSYGGDPNKALAYAADRKDMPLFSDLVYSYGADANLSLDQAVRVNQVEFMKVSLDASADPNRFLQSFSDAGNESYTRLMLEYGGDPNLAVPGAVEKKNIKLLSDLLSMGATVEGKPYLNRAVQLGSYEMTNLLLANGANANQGIKTAVDAGNYKISELLLVNGASPGKLISIPASKGDLNLSRLLLNYGGNPNDGMPGAVQGDFSPIVKLFLEAGASAKGYINTPASRGNLDMVKMLVQYGADINKGMPGGVNGNHNGVVQFLLNQGANAKGYIQTPAGKGNLVMVTMLLEKGADPNKGMYPSVQGGHVSVVKKLIDSGAEANNDQYMLAAVTREHVEVTQLLIDNGAQVNSFRDAKQNTLLHLAADVKKNVEMIQVLVGAKAELDVFNNDGETPLHVCARNGKRSLESVMVLVEAGANVNACNDKGKSVMQRARSRKVKKYLEEKGAEKRPCK